MTKSKIKRGELPGCRNCKYEGKQDNFNIIIDFLAGSPQSKCILTDKYHKNIYSCKKWEEIK